ncbi:MAG: DUF5610 domain-containing protein [Zoogloeaceae bacterium]|jgi:hypothetical protein|nr:DUF5610 domain-containing protein [Zoogloeaceae bacterium]
MEITNAAATSQLAQQNPALTTTTKANTTDKTEQTDKTSTASLRDQLNKQIVEASLKVSITTGNQSQELLYKSALSGINEALGTTSGAANSVEAAYQNGVDVSPEATAGRILDVVTGFYDGYLKQHPGVDEETNAANFAQLIKGGFEKGFNDAAKVLSGLGVWSGDIKANADKTADLFNKGLDEFLANRLQPKETRVDESAA